MLGLWPKDLPSFPQIQYVHLILVSAHCPKFFCCCCFCDFIVNTFNYIIGYTNFSKNIMSTIVTSLHSDTMAPLHMPVVIMLWLTWVCSLVYKRLVKQIKLIESYFPHASAISRFWGKIPSNIYIIMWTDKKHWVHNLVSTSLAEYKQISFLMPSVHRWYFVDQHINNFG